jgi:hypothetical protein
LGEVLRAILNQAGLVAGNDAPPVLGYDQGTAPVGFDNAAGLWG